MSKDEFIEIEKKMLAEKGAWEILGGLKGEYQMALTVALANLVQSQGTKVEADDMEFLDDSHFAEPGRSERLASTG